MFDLVEPLLGLTFLGSVVGGVLYAQRRRIARLSVALVAPWAEAAERLGLALDADHGWRRRGYRLSGERDGRPVQVAFSISGDHTWPPWGAGAAAEMGLPSRADTHVVPPGETRVSAPVRAALPQQLTVRQETSATETLRYLGLQDLQIGDAALDSALLFSSGQPAATVALAQHPAARRAFAAIAAHEGLELRDGRVTLRRSGELLSELEGLLDLVRSVAQDLEVACNGALLAVARQEGLDVAQTNQAVQAKGAVEGLRAALVGAAGGLILRVWLPEGAPAGLQIRAAARDGESAPRVPLSNPILARAIDVRAHDPGAAATRFTEAATEAVLAVVRGHDDAVVADGVVEVHLSGEQDAAGLTAALREAVALARAMGPGG